nr:RNA-directed DNA polymerase, eukaryota [Tanacetum cinerariifolium]
MVHAKELFTWSPCFLEYNDPGYLSEDEYSLDGNNNLGNSQQGNVNQVEESDVDGANSHHSDDPFGLYDLLSKSTNLSASKEDLSLSHPLGFTLVASHQDPIHSNSAHLEVNQDEPPITKGSSSKSYPKASCFSQASHGNDSSADSFTHVSSRSTPKGGSILEVLDGMIRLAVLWVMMWKVARKISNKSSCYKEKQMSFGLKRILWDYISGLITRWNGETIVLGDFNEVRSKDERFGSIFHQSYAREFNHFISSSGLLEVKMEGYSFTWSHSSASKMSKLDRFLVSEGISVTFPTISAICLDRHLSDHRPILLMRFIQIMVPPLFVCIIIGSNGMVSLLWWKMRNQTHLRLVLKKVILDDLVIIDKNLEKGLVSDDLLAKRMDLSRKLHDLKQMELKDAAQKAKVNWAIEGDENSKFFHEVINKRRFQLAIRGVFVNGDWYTNPSMAKEAFLDHFTARFKQPSCGRLKLNMCFPNRLSSDQVDDLDKDISIDEIRKSVWDCAVNCFFDKGRFSRGSNSSFIALIPKVMDAKFVTDFRPISLIGSVYKVVTKILAKRLTTVISGLISNTQSAFVANRHILDGPFILNEVLAWCKKRRKQALVFKVDFAKAYDSV